MRVRWVLDIVQLRFFFKLRGFVLVGIPYRQNSALVAVSPRKMRSNGEGRSLSIHLPSPLVH